MELHPNAIKYNHYVKRKVGQILPEVM